MPSVPSREDRASGSSDARYNVPSSGASPAYSITHLNVSVVRFRHYCLAGRATIRVHTGHGCDTRLAHTRPAAYAARSQLSGWWLPSEAPWVVLSSMRRDGPDRDGQAGEIPRQVPHGVPPRCWGSKEQVGGGSGHAGGEVPAQQGPGPLHGRGSPVCGVGGVVARVVMCHDQQCLGEACRSGTARIGLNLVGNGWPWISEVGAKGMVG